MIVLAISEFQVSQGGYGGGGRYDGGYGGGGGGGGYGGGVRYSAPNDFRIEPALKITPLQ